MRNKILRWVGIIAILLLLLYTVGFTSVSHYTKRRDAARDKRRAEWFQKGRESAIVKIVQARKLELTLNRVKYMIITEEVKPEIKPVEQNDEPEKE